MKTGKTLNELAAEITRQAESKKDYVASTKDMKAVVLHQDNGAPVVKLELGGKSGETFGIGDTAHDQIAEETDIPAKYYRRMLAEKPQLLAANINEWFEDKPRKRLLRTLDGKARALRSDRYRMLDNYDFLEAALPALKDKQVVSCEVTEKKLFLKVVDPRIQRHIPSGFRMGDGSHVGFKVPSGEIVPAGQLGNSEIGVGSLFAERGYLDNGCTNLMWGWKAGTLKKVHLGSRLDVGEELYKLLSDETRAVTDQAIWMQFRDAIKAMFSEEGFEQLAETLREAAGEKIEADVVKVVEVTAKRFRLGDDTRSSVLKHLIEGGDLSKFGLANAITSAAQGDQIDYETATELEALGGQIIALPKRQWQQLSTAKVIDAEWKEVA